MELAARMDEYGKPAWIALTIVAFIVFWPVGLVLLGYLIWSGRMGCWRKCGPGRWYETREGRGGRGRGARWKGESSGNAAFDEYREETLRRLEEEQDEFETFLERLRHAKDKAEFDQFMADRQRRAASPDDGDVDEDMTGDDPGKPPYPRSPRGGAPQPMG
jgi:hypothetical protein